MTRQRKTNRRERVPFGVASLKMNLDSSTMERLKKEEKVPRWINDVDDRIISAERGGYEFVDDSGHEAIKTGDAGEVQEQDRRIKRRVGKTKDGAPIIAYLMAIPKEYYDEDQAKKEEVNARVDQAIKGGTPPGLSGHGVSSTEGGAYVKNVDYQP